MTKGEELTWQRIVWGLEDKFIAVR